MKKCMVFALVFLCCVATQAAEAGKRRCKHIAQITQNFYISLDNVPCYYRASVNSGTDMISTSLTRNGGIIAKAGFPVNHPHAIEGITHTVTREGEPCKVTFRIESTAAGNELVVKIEDTK